MRNHILLIAILVGWCGLVSARDSLVVKLYSGIGEHTLHSGNRIAYRSTSQAKIHRSRIVRIGQDTIFLSNNTCLPINTIAEIGYYGRQEKIIKASGALLLGLAGYLVYAYISNTDKSVISTFLVTAGIGTGMIAMRRRMFKIPHPWKISTTPVGGEGIFLFK